MDSNILFDKFNQTTFTCLHLQKGKFMQDHDNGHLYRKININKYKVEAKEEQNTVTIKKNRKKYFSLKKFKVCTPQIHRTSMGKARKRSQRKIDISDVLDAENAKRQEEMLTKKLARNTRVEKKRSKSHEGNHAFPLLQPTFNNSSTSIIMLFL